MANRFADMHAIAPQLTEAVAKRITTSDLHDKRSATSARSSTAPSSRTSTPTPSASTTARYSTPPSKSTMPAHTSTTREPAGRGDPGCDIDRLDRELDALARAPRPGR